MTTAHLAGIGFHVPPPYSTERFIEVDRQMREAHGLDPEVHEMAARFARNTGIRRRHSQHPLLHQDPSPRGPVAVRKAGWAGAGEGGQGAVHARGAAIGAAAQQVESGEDSLDCEQL